MHTGNRYLCWGERGGVRARVYNRVHVRQVTDLTLFGVDREGRRAREKKRGREIDEGSQTDQGVARKSAATPKKKVLAANKSVSLRHFSPKEREALATCSDSQLGIDCALASWAFCRNQPQHFLFFFSSSSSQGHAGSRCWYTLAWYSHYLIQVRTVTNYLGAVTVGTYVTEFYFPNRRDSGPLFFSFLGLCFSRPSIPLLPYLALTCSRPALPKERWAVWPTEREREIEGPRGGKESEREIEGPRGGKESERERGVGIRKRLAAAATWALRHGRRAMAEKVCIGPLLDRHASRESPTHGQIAFCGRIIKPDQEERMPYPTVYLHVLYYSVQQVVRSWKAIHKIAWRSMRAPVAPRASSRVWHFGSNKKPENSAC